MQWQGFIIAAVTLFVAISDPQSRQVIVCVEKNAVAQHPRSGIYFERYHIQ